MIFGIITDDSFSLSDVSAASDSFANFPKAHSYEIKLRVVFSASDVLVNNIPESFECFYELGYIHHGISNIYT